METFSNLNTNDDTEDTSEDEWQDVFDRLDPKDGATDGRIDKEAFLEWMDTLDFQDTVMLEAKQGISRKKLRWLINTADVDKDNFIDREEFLRLVHSHSGELEKIQKNNLLKYMRIAAYSEEYRWWPPPCFTLSCSVLMISLFIYHTVQFHKEGVSVTWSEPPPYCSVLIFNPSRKYEIWRYVTYSLVHAGYEHILVNIILMWLVGLSLEMSNSWWRVATVHLFGVLSGSLLNSLIWPHTFLAGASGGVYALASAHIATIVLNWKEDSLILRQRLRKRKNTSPTFGKVVRVARILVVIGIPSVDVITGLSNLLTGETNTTSYIAHASGVGVGILVGLVILTNRRVEFWETWLRSLCCVTAVTYILILIILNIVHIYQDYPNQSFTSQQSNNFHSNNTLLFNDTVKNMLENRVSNKCKDFLL